MFSEFSKIAKPVVIYDTTKKTPIGIFRTISLAGKYVFGKETPVGNSSAIISRALKNKSKILKSKLDIPICVREACKQYVDALGSEDLIIFEGYPVPKNNFLKGFASYK